MSNAAKQGMSAIFAAMDSTERIKNQSDLGLLEPPPIPVGREKFTSIRKGTKIVSTGVGPIKQGATGKVVETHKNNGYNSYRVKWSWGGETQEREQDIERAV